MGEVKRLAAQIAADDPLRRCTVNRVLSTLDDENAEELVELIEDPAVSSTVVTEVIRRLGFQVGRDAVRHHRTGKCSCASRAKGDARW